MSVSFFNKKNDLLYWWKWHTFTPSNKLEIYKQNGKRISTQKNQVFHLYQRTHLIIFADIDKKLHL